jgi:hypothetical protein
LGRARRTRLLVKIIEGGKGLGRDNFRAHDRLIGEVLNLGTLSSLDVFFAT